MSRFLRGGVISKSDKLVDEEDGVVRGQVGRAKRRKAGVKHKANRSGVQVRRWLWETMVGQILSKIVDRIFTWVWALCVMVFVAVMAWLGFFTVSVAPRISSPGGELAVSVRVFPAPTIPVRR